jgi:hypothetical protein
VRASRSQPIPHTGRDFAWGSSSSFEGRTSAFRPRVSFVGRLRAPHAPRHARRFNRLRAKRTHDSGEDRTRSAPRRRRDQRPRAIPKSLTVYETGVGPGPDQNSDRWFHYFYFGSRFQNTIQYVAPTRDGGVAQFGPGGDLDARADLPSWLRRLSAAGITEVLTFPPRSVEQDFMDANPARFERLEGKKDWGLYRFLPEQ